MEPRRLEYLSLEAIPKNPDNPKRHALADIRASIHRFGFVTPLVIDERTGLIAEGHGRTDALRLDAAEMREPPEGILVDAQGFWSVPVYRGWGSANEAEARSFLVAANRLVEIGGWDDQALAEALQAAQRSDLALEGLGYTEPDISALLARVEAESKSEVIGDPDAVPEPPVDPISVRGDIWFLGKHRVMCGDATSSEDHEQVLQGQTVDLVLTDPPYGVGVEYDLYDDTNERTSDLVAAFMPLALKHRRVLLTPGVRQAWSYPKPTWILAWIHPAASGAGPWGFNCLNIILAYGPDPYLADGRGSRPDTLVMAADRQGVQGHPVAKPLEPWKWLLERGSAHRGERVFDPFCGSGTTVIAAELLGRIAYGLELSPAYVDVICARYQTLTGEKPIRESSNEPVSFL